MPVSVYVRVPVSALEVDDLVADQGEVAAAQKLRPGDTRQAPARNLHRDAGPLVDQVAAVEVGERRRGVAHRRGDVERFERGIGRVVGADVQPSAP